MKVTKENAVVGLKVLLDKDSQFAGQGIGAEYGVIVDNETHFPATPKYLWVQVNWIRADGTYISTNYYRIGDCGKFDLNVHEVIPEYVECIKGFNTDLSVNDFNVVGKIYEVEHYNPKTYILKLKGFAGSIVSIKFDGNSEYLSTDYKISDKASFEAQQNPKETLVGRYLKTLVNNPVSIGMNIGGYLLITKYNHQDNTYDVTRVRDNHTGFGIEVSHLPKFEVMPVGFNPKVEEEFKVGDWVTVIDTNIGKPHETIAFKSGVLTSKITEVCLSKDYRYRVNGIWCEVRKATTEEIAKAQKLQRDRYIDQAFTSKYTKEPWTVDAAYSEDYATFVKPKEKYKFSEVEYLLKPINQQLDLPIVKKYKKKSIINL